MPKARIDLTGRVFHRLTILHRSATRRHAWLCRCACGKEKEILASNLTLGITQSCGCLQRERTRAASLTHGRSGTPEHEIWQGMRKRCYQPTCRAYKDYGGRGIQVCDEWQDFARFYADMGPRPSPKHTVERHDNNGPYAPDNCSWAPRSEQANNTRRNRRLTLRGETRTLHQWAQSVGMTDHVLKKRLNRGWRIDKALTIPLQRGPVKRVLTH
jgi:hypothetical protein